MDRVPPEILHIVCSYLSTDDVLSFRLASRTFAETGVAYLLPEVTFYMHDEELERLRNISLHPVMSKNVESLTYFAEALDCPKVPFREFLRDYKKEMRWNSKLKRLNLTGAQLLAEYRKYEIAADRQREIMESRIDVAVLREVLPRLTSLQCLTMSAGNIFYEGRIRSRRHKPLEKTMRGDYMLCLNPEGKRPLEALLMANAEVNCALRSLRAGGLHWNFFRRSAVDLAQLFRPLHKLEHIEFIINVEDPDSRGEHQSGSLRRCRRVLGKGALRSIFKSMP